MTVDDVIPALSQQFAHPQHGSGESHRRGSPGELEVVDPDTLADQVLYRTRAFCEALDAVTTGLQREHQRSEEFPEIEVGVTDL